MKRIGLLVTLTASAAFIMLSCGILGGDKKSGRDNSEESYSYQFEYNGCNTGAHEFSNKDAYCAALINEELNKGCAKLTRMQEYKAGCDPNFSIPGEGSGMEGKGGSEQPSPTPAPSPTPTPAPTPKPEISALLIEAKVKIDVVRTEHEDISKYFRHTVSVSFDAWDVTVGGDFKDSIKFEDAEMARITRLDFCSGNSRPVGALSATGKSIIQFISTGSNLCTMNLKGGYWSVELSNVRSLNDKKLIGKVLLSVEEE